MESSREREILALRCEGFSLAEIGQRFGVSRQRVDQIVRRAGGAEVGREASRARRAAEVEARREFHTRLAHERAEEILERYRRGADPQVIARDLRLQDKVVKGLIGRSRTGADKAARSRALQRVGSPKYSEPELRRGVRAAADRVGHAPKYEQYDRLAKQLGLASAPTVYMRFGGWHKALRAAGLEPASVDRTRTPRWHVAACWRAVLSVADQLGDPPRYRHYATLAAERADLPSGPTVRQRLGLWSDIAAQLIEHRSRSGRRRPPAIAAQKAAGPAAPFGLSGHGRVEMAAASHASDHRSRRPLPSQLAVSALRYLAQHPRSSGAAVRRGLEIRHDSHVWALLNRLEGEGLLAKHPNGRSSAWTLTDHGHRILHELPEGVYA